MRIGLFDVLGCDKVLWKAAVGRVARWGRGIWIGLYDMLGCDQALWKAAVSV